MQVTKSKKALKDCYFNGLYSQMISETLPDTLMIFEVKNGFYCAVDGDAWKIQTICPDFITIRTIIKHFSCIQLVSLLF